MVVVAKLRFFRSIEHNPLAKKVFREAIMYLSLNFREEFTPIDHAITSHFVILPVVAITMVVMYCTFQGAAKGFAES
jgi:hypothetical protein